LKEIISIAEYLNTNYAENQLVNILRSLERNHPNMNSTCKDNSKTYRRIKSTKGEQ